MLKTKLVAHKYATVNHLGAVSSSKKILPAFRRCLLPSNVMVRTNFPGLSEATAYAFQPAARPWELVVRISPSSGALAPLLLDTPTHRPIYQKKDFTGFDLGDPTKQET